MPVGIPALTRPGWPLQGAGVLEVDGLEGKNLEAVLDVLLPPPTAAGVIEGPKTNPGPSLTINTFNPQINTDVAGSVVQNIAGTVNFGVEAEQVLELAATFGGHERAQLETAVHELQDDGARGAERVAARGRLTRFLAPWASGHRGIDLAADAEATIPAPADGVVSFSGVVVDREVLSIDHGGGYISSFDPAETDPEGWRPRHRRPDCR